MSDFVEQVEASIMRRVLGALKRRRGCIPTPEVLAELSTHATEIANAALVELGRADLGPVTVMVSIDQPERAEPIGLGVKLGVARVTINYPDPAATPADVPDPWL